MRLVKPHPDERSFRARTPPPGRDVQDDDWTVEDEGENYGELNEAFVGLPEACLPPFHLFSKPSASFPVSRSRHHCHHARSIGEIGPLCERVQELVNRVSAVEAELARLKAGENQTEPVSSPMLMDAGRDTDLIQRLRAELPSEADWDGDGSPGYSAQAIERAVGLFCSLLRLGRRARVAVETPDFGPGPSGSIDLHWMGEAYELLINVPADPDSHPTFYGDNKGDIAIKGALDSDDESNLEELIKWLRGRA
jgi:hypothetical protein